MWGGGGGAGTASPPLPLRAGVGAGTRVGAGGTGKGKPAPDLAHCFELHSGKLLGDKRNREGRLYFKVRTGALRCMRHFLFGRCRSHVCGLCVWVVLVVF